MEDSPLIKQLDTTSHLTSVNNASAVNTTHAYSQLVNATHPGSDTSSALSSFSFTASSASSCNSCCAPATYLPKSTSNPLLLTLATQHSSSSLASVAPASPTSTLSGSSGNLNHHQFHASSVLDLFIKKSPQTDLIDNYDSYNSSTNTSIVTVACNNTSLLTSVAQHQEQTGAINSAVETAAKKYRCAAQISEATCCWKGKFDLIKALLECAVKL